MIHYFEQKYSLKLVYIETIWWWFCIKFKSSPSIWYDITKKGNSSLSRNSQEFMDQDRFWWIIGQPWSKWKRKWQTDLIPALDCIARRLGLVVEEDDVDLLGQLGHGGEDEGERRDDHHRHRRERTYLRKSALFAQEAIVLRLTLAANEVSGYSVKFHKYFRTLSLFFLFLPLQSSQNFFFFHLWQFALAELLLLKPLQVSLLRKLLARDFLNIIATSLTLSNTETFLAL